MSLYVFIDTEFTNSSDPQLLSIGLVCETGAECYVELDISTLREGANTFVQDTVIPQWGLTGIEVPGLSAAGAYVRDWLKLLPANELFICYDYHADMDLLEAAMAGSEVSQKLVPTHVGYLLGEDTVASAMEQSWDASFGTDCIARHHALADARALRAGFLAMHGPF
jgi:hypothetical protein